MLRQLDSDDHPIRLYLRDASDGLSPWAGDPGDVAAELLKPESTSFSGAMGAVTAVEDGIYELAGHAGDRDAYGDTILRVSAPGAITWRGRYTVVRYDPIDPEPGAAEAVLTAPDGVEDGWTLRQVLRLMAAVLLGRTAGATSSEPEFRAIDDSKVRVSASISEDGDRAEVELDAS